MTLIPLNQITGTAAADQRSKASAPAPEASQPAVCPICHGKRYIRLKVPLGHKDFGKMVPCVCLASQIEAEQRGSLYQHSGLPGLSDATFDTFIPSGRAGISPVASESLRHAFETAEAYAKEPFGWLILQGGVGCGKTHLAAAIANRAVAAGVPAYFETVPDMLDRLRGTFGTVDDQAFSAAFDRVRTVRLLVLDDLGTENQTPWAVEKLFQIINFRCTNRLPTVITTNVPLDRIEVRIRSRLQDDSLSVMLEIQAPDYRQGERAAVVSSSKKKTGGWLPEKTFANFDQRHNAQISTQDQMLISAAFAAAKEFARHPNGFLVLAGPSWCGKTHLMSAIANQRKSIEAVRYYTMHDLIDYIRGAYDSKEEGDGYTARMDELRGAPLLLLDEFDILSASVWGRERLTQIINYRHAQKLPTVIATTKPIHRSPEFPIFQRLLDPNVSKVCVIHTAYQSQSS